MKTKLPKIVIVGLIFSILNLNILYATVADPVLFETPSINSIGTEYPEANLFFSPQGLAACYGMLTLKSGYSCRMTLSLQKFEKGNWLTQNSWESTFQSGRVSFTKTASCANGIMYRVVLYALIYFGDDFVEIVTTSSSGKYM